MARIPDIQFTGGVCVNDMTPPFESSEQILHCPHNLISILNLP